MQKLNSAGVIQMVIDKLPEMASAVAQPLSFRRFYNIGQKLLLLFERPLLG